MIHSKEQDLKNEWNETDFADNIWKDKNLVDVEHDRIFDWWLSKLVSHEEELFWRGYEEGVSHQMPKEYLDEEQLTEITNLIKEK